MSGSGMLDRKVTIQQSTSTPDAFGQPIDSWSAVATVWCSKKDLLSTSTMLNDSASQIATKTASQFTIRYRSDFPLNGRLLFENEVYEIVRVAERGRKRYLEVIAYAIESDVLD